LSIDVYLPRITNNLNYGFSYRNFAAGNYTLLYNILSVCDWSGVYETASVGVAVASLSVLNATVQDAMEQAVPRSCTNKAKFPPCFCNTLRLLHG
jgi:hypothetical protein